MMKKFCGLISAHVWTFWEDVGIAPYFKIDQFQLVQERTCSDCGKKQRRFAGWATITEVNAEGAAAMKVAGVKK